ncbi:hypothetical protein VTK26DRAFT_5734 [Humicola hyalothermophila]
MWCWCVVGRVPMFAVPLVLVDAFALSPGSFNLRPLQLPPLDVRFLVSFFQSPAGMRRYTLLITQLHPSPPVSLLFYFVCLFLFLSYLMPHATVGRRMVCVVQAEKHGMVIAGNTTKSGLSHLLHSVFSAKGVMVGSADKDGRGEKSTVGVCGFYAFIWSALTPAR